MLASLHSSIVTPVNGGKGDSGDFSLDKASMHLKSLSVDGDCNKHNEGIDVEPTNEDALGEGGKASAKKTMVEMYDSKKKRHEEEAEAALKFTKKPQGGLKYASESGHLDTTDPVDVVQYLLQNKDVFKKVQIGEYLGSEKEWQDNWDRRAVKYTLYARSCGGRARDLTMSSMPGTRRLTG